MKTDYSKNVRLRCVVCGSDCHFEFNEDKSFVKCTKCNREYFGGYDELVTLNQDLINEELTAAKEEILRDVREDLTDSLKRAFKDNKYIRFK